MTDPYLLSVHNPSSKSAASRARYLLHLLKAQALRPDKWRLPRGDIIRGKPEDFARSVDCVKQLESWIVSAEKRMRGYSELFLSAHCTPPLWDAEIRDTQDRLIATSGRQTVNEALARIEALINYIKATSAARW